VRKSGYPCSYLTVPDPEGTAESAEIAEPNLLCGLCELGGFFFAVTPDPKRAR
jgi:hypothetical protein